MSLREVTGLTDDNLEQLRVMVETEQTNRRRRADLAEEVSSALRQYVEAGGDTADLDLTGDPATDPAAYEANGDGPATADESAAD